LKAQQYADAAKDALSTLPQSPARAALAVLVDYALQRDH
jgi:geranylgeranyl pyrophosphate synthase